jgi:zinc protease
LTDPGYREEAVRIYQHYVPSRLSDYEHTLNGPWQQLSQLLKGGDDRYAIPTEDQMLSYQADNVRAWIGPQLAESYLELSIVGAIPESVIDMILATLGAIPERAEFPVNSNYSSDLIFPDTPQELTVTFNSKDPQAAVVLAFEVMPQTESSINETRYMNVLANVFDHRLFDEIREELGAAYSPGATSTSYRGFDHGELIAYAMVHPENATLVGNRIQVIANSLATDGVTNDELLRSTEPLLSKLQQTLETNDYWVSVMDGSQAEPFQLDWARSVLDVYSNIDLDELNKLAGIYLPVAASVLVTMLPINHDESGEEEPTRDRFLSDHVKKLPPRFF